MAPLSVLDALSDSKSTDPAFPHRVGTSGWEKIQLTREIVQNNLKILLAHPDFIERMRSIYERKTDYATNGDVEASLYAGFLPDCDKEICKKIQVADFNQLSDFQPDFIDERLPKLFLHYKARNFKNSLSSDELILWEADRKERIKKQSKLFFASLHKLESLLMNSGKTVDGREIKPEILTKLQEWYRTVQG